MALWEARAAHLNQPLIELLGGVKPHLETSFILGIAKPQIMLEEARQVVQAGVRVLKIKVGRNTEADLTITNALKTEFGNTVKLYADSNETLEPDNAAKSLEKMRQEQLKACSRRFSRVWFQIFMGVLEGSKQVNRVAVRVFEDRVPLPPEGIPRRPVTFNASLEQFLILGIHFLRARAEERADAVW